MNVTGISFLLGQGRRARLLPPIPKTILGSKRIRSSAKTSCPFPQKMGQNCAPSGSQFPQLEHFASGAEHSWQNFAPGDSVLAARALHAAGARCPVGADPSAELACSFGRASARSTLNHAA